MTENKSTKLGVKFKLGSHLASMFSKHGKVKCPIISNTWA